MEDHLQPFSWKNVEPLLGLPRSDPRIGELFAQVGLPMDELWREVRVGIDSMPPHDQEPASVAEVDLTPSYHVRLRFHHARLVQGARTGEPQTFVLAAMTYFLDPSQPGGGYQGDLPAGIEGGDPPSRIMRPHRPPSFGTKAGSPPNLRLHELGRPQSRAACAAGHAAAATAAGDRLPGTCMNNGW